MPSLFKAYLNHKFILALMLDSNQIICWKANICINYMVYQFKEQALI